jgi:hypothetical protein
VKSLVLRWNKGPEGGDKGLSLGPEGAEEGSRQLAVQCLHCLQTFTIWLLAEFKVAEGLHTEQN